ncbi:hypothetical protein DPMN_072947 [Dreissena polymorpha]|uniref:Uncharacterized protein n=1 Tax=Dreissena polymorpha TaxID=45954 RepID=A0A9D4BY83_DREPO|nr:hypothetical protein DPMN_072947 [Dreissena polymorpha]
MQPASELQVSLGIGAIIKVKVILQGQRIVHVHSAVFRVKEGIDRVNRSSPLGRQTSSQIAPLSGQDHDCRCEVWDLISNEIMHKTHLAKAMTGEIREGLLIAEHYAMVVVISKKFALPISTVEENMSWALRRLRVMYCGENI